jgi:hypothetical protein
VKARRAIGFACRNAAAPLRRAVRAASWAIEFMMTADGIEDEEWSFGLLKLLGRGERNVRKDRENSGRVKLKWLTACCSCP